MEEITSLKKLGECEKTTNLGRIKNVRGWLDKMSRNRNGGRGDCVQTKGKKERVALINTQQQFALEKRKNYVDSICEMMTRAGFEESSSVRLVFDSKKRKLFTTFYNSLWITKGGGLFFCPSASSPVVLINVGNYFFKNLSFRSLFLPLQLISLGFLFLSLGSSKTSEVVVD